MKIKVRWNFKDTEFETFSYKEAMDALELPSIVEIFEDDLVEIDIEEELFEEWGFPVKSFRIINEEE